MGKAGKGYEKWLNKQIEAVMGACLVTSVEVLKDKFGFTQEQLNEFAEQYVPVLQKNLKK